MSFSSKTWAAVLLFCALPAHARNPPYWAVYEVSLRGETIGVATVTVGFDGATTYTVETKFTANGKRGFLINMLADAHSGIVATLADSTLRAGKVSTGRSRKESTIEFDWQRGVATSSDGRRRSEIPLRGNDKNDRRDALAKAVFVETRWIPGNHAIADLEPGVEPTRGPEEIQTPLGVYVTTSVGLPLSSRWKLTLWSAPELDGLPVKLEIGDSTGRAVLFALAALGDESVESRDGEATR
ncbi:MAG: DUF3108 domain-containing protein [Gammaproteobacteria bacterium]